METFGQTLRSLRQKKNLPLRKVAAYLDIDQAILSKIETGLRTASRLQVVKLANFFEVEEKDLMILWLSEKLVAQVEEESMALQALQVAEEKMEYLTFQKIDRKEILQRILSIIKTFDKIKKAWLFGSFVREDDDHKSDIDIAIDADPSFSYFDLIEVQHTLEQSINKKFDVGFIDSFRPYVLDNIRPTLKLIYER